MADFDVLAVARDYLGSRSDLGPAGAAERAATARLDLDADYCREVADRFDRAPVLSTDPDLLDDYQLFAGECRAQYEAIRAAGIEVRPWLRSGQPYLGSAELFDQVRTSRVLHVHLTVAGHGPFAATGWHPLREPSGVIVDGTPLTHNDLFRAAHDVFGHLLGRSGFGPAGELRAAHCHLTLYPPRLHRVLFAEHVAQICWFFYGRHLRDAAGGIPRPGEPGHRPPHDRPYPPQKVFPFGTDLIARFGRMFTTREPA
ncbi:hypothetical protein ABZ570_16720 [Micromonospora sp. NPDC007271]|uniref:hypothetical protein n=1 Tax=Micromonospora sp. NPDC007271 TaxID=3154587 RepID=UPI0033F89F4F